jgi:3-hydroxybutyryl-CoA dehydrogenase
VELRTGAPRRDLPERYGPWQTCYDRLVRWPRDGTWDRLLAHAQTRNDAVRGAWMVIEVVPEKLDLKREVFGQLDALAESDAILASNSSSLPTSRFIDKVKHPERVLNTQYQQPPELNSVELMSCGRTDDAVIDALMDKVP